MLALRRGSNFDGPIDALTFELSATVINPPIPLDGACHDGTEFIEFRAEIRKALGLDQVSQQLPKDEIEGQGNRPHGIERPQMGAGVLTNDQVRGIVSRV